MFILKICVWIKSGNIFLAHPVYQARHFVNLKPDPDRKARPDLQL